MIYPLFSLVLAIPRELFPHRRLRLTTGSLCAQVNTSPFEQGWIIKVKISNKAELDQLMDSEAYKKEIEH